MKDKTKEKIATAGLGIAIILIGILEINWEPSNMLSTYSLNITEMLAIVLGILTIFCAGGILE